jgi:transcriptional regulator with XRE-family HTH domain
MTNRIKELRDARGLTLEQVAHAAETSFQQVQRLERGDRRLTDDWMRRLAPILGVPPAALLADEAPDHREFVKDAEEAALLRFWRILEPGERRMIASFAREKGLEILANKPKRRSA